MSLLDPRPRVVEQDHANLMERNPEIAFAHPESARPPPLRRRASSGAAPCQFAALGDMRGDQLAHFLRRPGEIRLALLSMLEVDRSTTTS
jgi:hypothetical protein